MMKVTRLPLWGKIALGSLCLLGLTQWASPVRAVTPLTEILVTILEANDHDSLLTGSLFPVDNAAALEYEFAFDEGARSFTYTLLPGQTYRGMSVSHLMSGAYNAGLGRYEWTSNGEFGGDAWSNDGTAEWSGNEADFATEGTHGAESFDVSTHLSINDLGFGSTSTTVTYTENDADLPFISDPSDDKDTLFVVERSEQHDFVSGRRRPRCLKPCKPGPKGAIVCPKYWHFPSDYGLVRRYQWLGASGFKKIVEIKPCPEPGNLAFLFALAVPPVTMAISRRLRR